MIYFQTMRPNWYVPPGSSMSQQESLGYFATFLKPMTLDDRRHGMLDYGYYNESEWRIIFDEEIAKGLRAAGRGNIAKRFVKVDEISDPDFKERVATASRKPGYVIPIHDQWLALIIYPAIAVKVLAQADREIRDLLLKIKPPYPHKTIENNASPAPLEKHSLPMELDLDACQHF